MSDTDQADRIERLEAKVDRVLEMLERADAAIGSFLTGPGITRMFRALAKGGKE